MMSAVVRALLSAWDAKSSDAMGTPAARVFCEPQKKTAIRSEISREARGLATHTMKEKRSRKRRLKRRVAMSDFASRLCHTPSLKLWQKEA